MADIFKMLLEGAQKTRAKKATSDKLKSIMNNPETSDYEKRNERNASDDLFSDFEDFSLGEERDKADYLSDIQKISLKELDKQPPKEQLKVLKIEYNRLFDRLESLNNSLTSSEKLISDLQMDRREDQKEVSGMKELVRKIVYLFPGQTNLKEIVDRGHWEVDKVFEPIENTIKNIIVRLKQTDDIIEEAVGKVTKENELLKEKILQYKQYLTKIEQLEKVIMEQHTNKQKQVGISESVTTSPSLSKVEEVESVKLEKEEPVSNKTETQKEKFNSADIHKPIEEKNIEQSTTEHNPHFTNFLDEFKTSFEKMKQQEKIQDEVVEKEGTEAKEEAKIKFDPSPLSNDKQIEIELSIAEELKKDEMEKKHPLSPDFVEVEKEEIDDLFDDETIEAYLQNLSVQQEYLLTVIGKTGISRNSDLKDYLKEDGLGQQYYFVGKKYNSNAVNRDIAELRDKGILTDEQISYGGKGGGTFNVYELSKTGKTCFKKVANDNPVIPEKKRIKDHHASLEHGYLIKDSAKIFREMEFKVYTDLNDVSIKIDPKHRKVFDFIVEDEEGKLMHIEVERGTHTQDDFSYAMDKIYEITKEFYFICPNENVKNKKTKKQFFTWVTKKLGGIQNADVVLNMTTIEQLRKKQKNIWEVTDLRNVK